MSFIKIEKISARKAWQIRGILAAVILFSFLITKFYPYDIIRYFFPDAFSNESSCIVLNVLGIPCPFCGMSHALAEAMQLNFQRSMYYNPSSVIIFTFLGLLSLSIFTLSLYNYELTIIFNKKILLVCAVLFGIVWVLNVCFGHLQ